MLQACRTTPYRTCAVSNHILLNQLTSLKNADLPILIRARCHTMLALRIHSNSSVEHGERAVQLLDVEARKIVSPEQFPQKYLDEAQKALEAAKRRRAAKAAKDGVEKEKDVEMSDAGEQMIEETGSTLPLA